MTPFTTLTGIAAALPIDNIDTDQILPGRYLKTIGRAGLGEGLFAALRFDDHGRPQPDFVLNRPACADARVLVTGMNFGCGSSREHAPWALLDYGIGCVVAAGFADIFFANSVNCGLLPATVTPAVAADLARRLKEQPGAITVDLVGQTLRLGSGDPLPFAIPNAARDRLLRGVDMVAETLAEEDDIAAFEAAHRDRHAWSQGGGAR